MQYYCETHFLCNSREGGAMSAGVSHQEALPFGTKVCDRHHSFTDPKCQAQGWGQGTHSPCPQRG